MHVTLTTYKNAHKFQRPVGQQGSRSHFQNSHES